MAAACGECTMCCKVFAIPDIDKPAGKWCKHCAIGKGCGIYASRPEVCRTFECMWLQSQSQPDERDRFAEEFRPDKCKVVIAPTTNDRMMNVMLQPGYPDAWRKPLIMALLELILDSGSNLVIGYPATTHMTILSRGKGGKTEETQVEMTKPDENGMQWYKSGVEV